MRYNDELRRQYRVLANISDKLWHQIFEGKKFSEVVNEQIIKMIGEKKYIESVFNFSPFSRNDICLAIRDYHALSPEEWHQLVADFSLSRFDQEHIAVVAGDLDYLNTYFFNDPEAFKERFKANDYQILVSAAAYDHFDIVNRLFEVYPEELPEVFKKEAMKSFKK